MKNRKINLVKLAQYKIEEDQFDSLHGGNNTYCSCDNCSCTCAVEPSAEWANTFNDGANSTGNTTLSGGTVGGGDIG